MTLNERIEKALAGYLPDKDCLEKRLIESMEYSLLAGGRYALCLCCRDDTHIFTYT